MRHRIPWVLRPLLFGIVLVAGRARAASPPPESASTAATASASPPGSVRLAWVRSEGAQDCMTGNALEAELVERMARNPFDGSPRQWIEGFVTRQGERYEVQLYERDARGHTIGSRKLSEVAKSCRGLDEPIVLAIALIIDPNVKLKQRSVTPVPVSAPLSSPSPVPATPPTPAPSSAPIPAPTARTRVFAEGTRVPPSVASGTATGVPSASSATGAPSSTGAARPGDTAAVPVASGTAAVPVASGTATGAPNATGAALPPVALPSVAAPTRETTPASNMGLYRADTNQNSLNAPAPAAGNDPVHHAGQDTAGNPTELQAAALLNNGLLPRTAFGVELGSRVMQGSFAFGTRFRYFPEQRSSHLGDFGFGATLLGLDACYRMPRRRAEWVSCVEVAAGALHAIVHAPLPLKPGDRFTASVGVDSGLGFHLYGPLWLDVRVAAAVLPRPWDFRLIDSKTGQRLSVYEQRWLTFGGAVGLAARLF